MVPRIAFCLLCLPALAWLGACGSEAEPPSQRESDPLLTRALNEPLTFDPDLVALNRANSAVSLPWQDGYGPMIDNHPQAISAARGEALRLVGGGGAMRRAPDASGGESASLVAAAKLATGAKARCVERVGYSAQWAAQMPAAFPVYPRGAVQEAAGTDVPGCGLRAVHFVTPVTIGDVIDFYYTRALAAGFSAERVVEDGDDVLAGVKGRAAYIVYARRLPTGNTAVDLVTSG